MPTRTATRRKLTNSLIIGWRLALLAPALILGWYLFDSVIRNHLLLGASGDWSLVIVGSISLAMPVFGAATILSLLLRPMWAETLRRLLGWSTRVTFLGGAAFLAIFAGHFERGQWVTAASMVLAWFVLEAATRIRPRPRPTISTGTSNLEAVS